jgi:Ricin-type beta-trefoil lectin domain-like
MANGAKIIQWDMAWGLNQLFHLAAGGQKGYSLTARHSGKTIDVEHASSIPGTPPDSVGLAWEPKPALSSVIRA